MNEIKWCIDYLKNYNHIKDDIPLPEDRQLRALMNITMPGNISEEFYLHQDLALKEIYKNKKITDADSLSYKKNIAIWQGDITCMKADAITNACNEKLLGCFSPLHSCIDNAIHSFAGLEVRRDLMETMMIQGFDEPNGRCKITRGYNLPSEYILHTVGPKAFGHVTKQNEKDLRSCYLSCLKMAEKYELKTIVFCSISTGVYGYPVEEASKIAFLTVLEFLKDHPKMKVIFNVFSDYDFRVYQEREKEYL